MSTNKTQAKANTAAPYDFKAEYTNLVNIKGYRGNFIRNKIATHCGVKESTVAGWIAGKNIAEWHLKALREFSRENTSD